MSKIFDKKVRERAYYLWQETGCQDATKNYLLALEIEQRLLTTNNVQINKKFCPYKDLRAKLSTSQCSVCLESDCDYRSNCGHNFHLACLASWMLFQPGDFLDLTKTCCPECRRQLPLTFEQSKLKSEKQLIYHHHEISVLEAEDQIYRICQKCWTYFPAGPKSCDATREEFPTNCESCQEKIFKIIHCPGCGLGLEHKGGCRDFVCCRYGYDGCGRDNCDHGSAGDIKFCGHRWILKAKDIWVKCGCDEYEAICFECLYCYDCCECLVGDCGCRNNGRCDHCENCDDCCSCTIGDCGCKANGRCGHCENCNDCCSCSVADCGCKENGRCEHCENCDDCCSCSVGDCGCKENGRCEHCKNCDDCCECQEDGNHLYKCGCKFQIGDLDPMILGCEECRKCHDCCQCKTKL